MRKENISTVNLALAGDPQQNNGSARNSQPDRYQLATRNRTDINSQLATDRYQLATDKYQLTTRN